MLKQWIEGLYKKPLERFKELDGWLSDQEAFGLQQTASKLPRNATVVEIGSWQGKSTYCIAAGLRSGKIYAIDPFNADAGSDADSQKEYQQKGSGKNLLEQFNDNMQRLKVSSKIIVRQGYSQNFYLEFKEIDFLFIDGDHSIEGCTSDFNLYAPALKKNGIIAFHDYYEDRPHLGPTHVIQQLIPATGQYRFLRSYDSLWTAEKIT